eukprot:ctg_1509.g492
MVRDGRFRWPAPGGFAHRREPVRYPARVAPRQHGRHSQRLSPPSQAVPSGYGRPQCPRRLRPGVCVALPHGAGGVGDPL